MCGVVAAYEGDNERALRAYETALLLLATDSEAADRFVEANCLRNYALSIYTLNNSALALAALACYDGFAWTADLAQHRFDTALTLAELFGSWGDDIRTYRLLRDAQECAADPASLLYVHAVRCAQAHRGGEQMFAMNEFTEAVRLVDEIDWTVASAGQRLALLEFAVSAAPLDCTRARVALTTYVSHRAKDSALYLASADPRLNAREDYSFGIVAAAEGRRDEALELLGAAITQSNESGFHFLAARAARMRDALTAQPAGAVPAGRPPAATLEILEQFLPAKNRRAG
jgi:tetratricopeptide (TPR) repeat protein